MGIGVPELVVVALVLLLLLGVVVGAILFARGMGGQRPGLIACPACKRQVSPRAAACPHCGDPIARR